MARAGSPRPTDLVHLKPSNAAGLLAFGTTTVATCTGVALSSQHHWGAWLAGQILLAAALLQWFVVLHECGHHTLFRTRLLNRMAGRLAGFFAIIPYACWTLVHARHHRWTGWQDLDPTTETLTPRPRGRAERAIVNFCWKYWIPLFSVTYRALNYWNARRLSAMFPARGARRAMASDAIALIAGYGALVFALGPLECVRVMGAALILSFIAEDVLLLSQHTHVPQQIAGGAHVAPVPAPDQELFTRSLRLPRNVSALLLHFDAHELHHMYPFVPGYRLRRIPYHPAGEMHWWRWIRDARRVPGEVFLFQNRTQSGLDV
jgi:omega-6 fatty acid desaturase (delta-12 desaturase)